MLRRGINPLRKRVTLFFDRGSKGRPLRLTVSWWVLLLFSLAILGLVGEGGRFIVCGVTNLISRCKIAHLENIKQKILKKYALLEQEADSLGGILALVDMHDYELRTTNNFAMIPEETRRLGVGGPLEESEEMTELRRLGSKDYKDISKFSESVSALVRKARFQNQSFNEIDENLGDKKFMLDHTPSIIPAKGYFSSGFGVRVDPFEHRTAIHTGLDIADNEGKEGTPVMVSAGGICTFVGPDAGYGLCIRINHGNGIETLYGHLSRAYIWAGDEVQRFQVIGSMGSSGRATGPHLHYEVRVEGIPVNPKGYFVEDDTTDLMLNYYDSLTLSVPPVTNASSTETVPVSNSPAAESPVPPDQRYGSSTTFYWGDALSVRDSWQIPH